MKLRKKYSYKKLCQEKSIYRSSKEKEAKKIKRRKKEDIVISLKPVN
jgi:hypothetical protein